MKQNNKKSGDVPITEDEVLECQKNWVNAIESISKTYLGGGDFVAEAGEALGELYGYGHHSVLFKPTKAKKRHFRHTAFDAISYCVGAEALEKDEFNDEDSGFAINSGRGWSKVVFKNHAIDKNGNTAIAMGLYYFTDTKDGRVTSAEYTLGYKRCTDGKPRIFVHHSSFTPEKVPLKEEVL